MKDTLTAILRLAVAGFLGYLAIALGTTLVLEVALGGFDYGEASALELALAGVGSILAGLAGGYLAGLVGGREPLPHAIAVLIFLTIDTTFVVTSGVSDEPLWFSLVAGATLMAATVAGGLLRQAQLRRPAAPAAASD